MLNKEFITYICNDLLEIINSNSNALNKLKKVYSIQKEIFDYISKDEPQYFTSYYAKLIFALDKFKFSEILIKEIKTANYLIKKLFKNDSISDSELDYYINLTISIITFLNDGNEVLTELANYVNNKAFSPPLINSQSQNDEFIPFVNAIVKKRIVKNNAEKKISIIICESEDIGLFNLILKYKWSDISKLVWKGANLNLFNIKKVISEDNTYRTSLETIIVIEPDYLLDVTEISECFSSRKNNPYIYFIKKYSHGSVSKSLILGNIVNSLFDAIISDNDIDFDTAYYHALSNKPFSLFVLARQDKNSIRILKENSKKHFESLKNIISEYKSNQISIEPSFISPKYGIQGRLDLLIEYKDDKTRKDIVELKSGSPPSPKLTMQTDASNYITTGLWINHLAQTSCYNLLLDSTFENRTGSSQILYSSDSEMPFRNAPNVIQMKQEVIECRNWIVALEVAIAKNINTIFDSFTIDNFGNAPSFLSKDIILFSNIYSNLDELEKKYFHQFVSFITRELLASKTGINLNQNGSGYSNLWKKSLNEKLKSYSILNQLTILYMESDFESMHIHLKRNVENQTITTFRKGDIVILYPIDESDEFNFLNNQILRCIIKDIDYERIIISLRNKVFDKNIFTNYFYWALEPDFMDSSYKNQYLSMFEFLKADKEIRNLLLGKNQPLFDRNTEIIRNELNDKQNELLNKALSAKNYFLIQGPPGTGKTSYLLKAIAEELYSNTDNNILLLAFTNRAVDEICSALKESEKSIDFIRLGSKESSEHTDNLISIIASKLNINELYKRVSQTRVFVSTITSILSNFEIFELKKFQVAIVDEASQLLEPQIIGILTKVNKFILIGDEKQLPSIVVQSSDYAKVNDEALINIGLKSLSTSIFERLINCCKANNWNDAYGMLNIQARMHQDIQAFPNQEFYGNKLEVFNINKWQLIANKRFNKNSSNKYESMLAQSRLLFIDVDTDKNVKANINEVNIINHLLDVIKDRYSKDFSNKTVGIISPFKAQCAEIMKGFDDGLRQNVMVDTVERFQGSERDIIIFSAATNFYYLLEKIEFLDNIDGIIIDRKLNVAITRAREVLIIIGNYTILKESLLYKKLINYIKEHGYYVNMKNIIELGINTD